MFCLPRLRAYLDRSGLPLPVVATRAGLSVAELAEIERGTRIPTADVLADLTAVLGCTVPDVHTVEPNPNSHDHYWAVMVATAPEMTPQEIATIGYILRHIDTTTTGRAG
ncbi:helix-turn-helix transcriptional regulator [Crossiella sp. S99.1]|uniref:helix-turn-helix domain-containing protein n=1 Tax=Crossiella sp. S99.1 TaxID=2936271 RepID=UPI0027E571B6|nr:helix-turn-helix transcriptional regulator [Crossiella sp. S99.1]